jgi:hypothetical protein
MARFLYEHPSGARYEINADDEAHASAMIADIVKQHHSEAPAPGRTGTANWGQNIPGWVAEALNWVNQHPEALGEFAAQGVGTGIGVLAGSPGGPPGQMIGGAAGNVLGKVLTRMITGAEQPGAGEVALDAITGGAGPALQVGAKGLARLTTGANRTVRRQASDAGRLARFESLRTNPTNSAAEAFEAAQTAHDRVLTNAIRQSGQWTSRVADVSVLAPAVGHLMNGDFPNAAMWLAGGIAASAVRRQAAEFMISKPWFRDWMVREATRTGATGGEFAVSLTGSLSALLGQATLAPAERRALQTLTRPEPDNTLGGDTVRQPPRPAAQPKGASWDDRSQRWRGAGGLFVSFDPTYRPEDEPS